MIVALVIVAVFAGALTRATVGFGEAVVSMPLPALLPIGLGPAGHARSTDRPGRAGALGRAYKHAPAPGTPVPRPAGRATGVGPAARLAQPAACSNAMASIL